MAFQDAMNFMQPQMVNINETVSSQAAQIGRLEAKFSEMMDDVARGARRGVGSRERDRDEHVPDLVNKKFFNPEKLTKSLKFREWAEDFMDFISQKSETLPALPACLPCLPY